MCMPPITKNHSKNIHQKALKLNEGRFYHRWDDPRPEPGDGGRPESLLGRKT